MSSLCKYGFRAGFGMLMLCCASLQAQTVNYIYGIQVSTYILDQFSISGSSYSVKSVANLPTVINASGGGYGNSGRYNQNINALALDPTTQTVFFTYSYNSDNTSASAGTFTAQSYAMRYNGSTFVAYLINTFSEAAGTTETPTTPGTTTVASGWMCRGAYLNGAYYIGVQNEDTMVKLTLAANEVGATTQTNVYSGINHNSTNTAGQGGDYVISSGSTIYVAGQYTSGTSFYTFASETLANAEAGTSGSAWTSGTVSNYLQLAGLGGITNMYAIVGATGTLNIVNNFQNPSAVSTTPMTLTSGSLTTYTDLSDGGSIASIVTPEPATLGAGIAGCAAVLVAIVRRRQKRDPGN